MSLPQYGFSWQDEVQFTAKNLPSSTNWTMTVFSVHAHRPALSPQASSRKGQHLQTLRVQLHQPLHPTSESPRSPGLQNGTSTNWAANCARGTPSSMMRRKSASRSSPCNCGPHPGSGNPNTSSIVHGRHLPAAPAPSTHPGAFHMHWWSSVPASLQ